MKKLGCVGFIVIFLGYIRCMSEVNLHDPVIESKLKNGKGIAVIHGVISENGHTVQLQQPLRATDADQEGGAKFICGYRVISLRKSIPFIVELVDRRTGEAVVKLAKGKTLNYEKRKRYKFSVIAYDCGSTARESNRAIIFVKVKDVDEFAPVFDKPDFTVDIEEGRLYDPLIKLHAHDPDRSKQFSKICDYEILSKNVPFTIDKEGNLKNTEKIDYNKRHNFILQIDAKDCGGKKSKTVFVNVKIKEKCKAGWTDFPHHLDYKAGSGKQKVAPKATLNWCDSTCSPDHVDLKMALTTKHIGKGCDRDTYSITSQKKICGSSDTSVDLLPPPSLTSTWTRYLPTDDGKESDQVFYFDGENNAVEVPQDKFNHTLHKHFTIMTWMKHEYAEPVGKKFRKEHILCMSDGDGMNRHHFSLFVHGEKLILLLRREASDAKDMEVFKPAEWRWHIPQINERDRWHHYAISVDFPQVRLYIDGNLLLPDSSNSEVVDDWPLHRTNKVHSTKLVVGACWEGGHKKFNHYFRGYLADLSVLKGKTESERVIHCLNNCQENLDFSTLSVMHSGTTVSFNREMTDFRIKSNNLSEVQALVREVHYMNARKFPTPGRRNLDVRTSMHCGKTETILPAVESYIMVHPAKSPKITLKGSTFFDANDKSLKAGIAVFDDIGINVKFTDEQENDVDHKLTDKIKQLKPEEIKLGKARKLQLKMDKKKARQDTMYKVTDKEMMLLDMCTVRADPPLNLRYEHMDLPISMKEFKIKIETSQTNAGLVITNADNIENYILILRAIRYKHENPQSFSSRKLILSCSSQNGRFVSNTLEVQVMRSHEEPRVVHAHAQESVQHLNLGSIGGTGSMGVAMASSSPNVGMVAIIVVCVGFLLFMIILGVIRIRAAHKKTQVVQVEPEMEWDNDMNITVNPMDEETRPLHVFEYDDTAGKSTLPDDTDSEDDCSSYCDECDNSDEETVPKKELEWDDNSF